MTEPRFPTRTTNNVCANCWNWAPLDMGHGFCTLSDEAEESRPLRGAGTLGTVETRIDFGCNFHQPPPENADIPRTKPPATQPPQRGTVSIET